MVRYDKKFNNVFKDNIRQSHEKKGKSIKLIYYEIFKLIIHIFSFSISFQMNEENYNIID